MKQTLGLMYSVTKLHIFQLKSRSNTCQNSVEFSA